MGEQARLGVALGQWQPAERCDDADVYRDGAEQTSEVACGINLRGRLINAARPDSGTLRIAAWISTMCTAASSRHGTAKCGLNARGHAHAALRGGTVERWSRVQRR